jgi:hypothetical protein
MDCKLSVVSDRFGILFLVGFLAITTDVFGSTLVDIHRRHRVSADGG